MLDSSAVWLPKRPVSVLYVVFEGGSSDPTPNSPLPLLSPQSPPPPPLPTSSSARRAHLAAPPHGHGNPSLRAAIDEEEVWQRRAEGACKWGAHKWQKWASDNDRAVELHRYFLTSGEGSSSEAQRMPVREEGPQLAPLLSSSSSETEVKVGGGEAAGAEEAEHDGDKAGFEPEEIERTKEASKLSIVEGRTPARQGAVEVGKGHQAFHRLVLVSGEGSFPVIVRIRSSQA